LDAAFLAAGLDAADFFDAVDIVADVAKVVVGGGELALAVSGGATVIVDEEGWWSK